MYEQHWRLQRPAFRSTAGADFFFSARTHEAALLKLRYLVEQRQGIAVLTGASGIGKSCVLQTFCEELPAPSGPVVPVHFPQMSSAELLGFLTAKLEGINGETPSGSDSLDHVLQRLENQLLRLNEIGRHPVFVIDDAHLIADRRVFPMLQLLLNYRRADHIEFSIVLAGQPELIGQVKRYEALFERLAFVSTLLPFEPHETACYVLHRLQTAGGVQEIFTAEAMQAIHELSGGLPRRINRLCDFALLVGYADNLERVTPAQIEAVAEELAFAA